MKDFDSWCKGLENSVVDTSYTANPVANEKLTIKDLSNNTKEEKESFKETNLKSSKEFTVPVSPYDGVIISKDGLLTVVPIDEDDTASCLTQKPKAYVIQRNTKLRKMIDDMCSRAYLFKVIVDYKCIIRLDYDAYFVDFWYDEQELDSWGSRVSYYATNEEISTVENKLWGCKSTTNNRKLLCSLHQMIKNIYKEIA